MEYHNPVVYRGPLARLADRVLPGANADAAFRQAHPFNLFTCLCSVAGYQPRHTPHNPPEASCRDER